MEVIKRNDIKIDATGKVLGKLAADIAVLLKGKDKPGYMPNKDTGDFVTVANIKNMVITGKKIEQKKYYHHTGYLGGLKSKSLKVLFADDPADVLRRAVLGMLPKNRLQAKRIKRLKFLPS